MIDNDEPDSHQLIREIFSKTGRAKTVGFTGHGGAGKSSLIGRLISEFQVLGYKVAILAVDPTSPISGGAILGDRLRMAASMNDESVFMRSMASRGAVGGISRSLRNAIRVLDAAGFNLILVESVGAGQLEIEISKVVTLNAVVFTPHTGDNIQAIKAGLTEIGDIYVINKGDLDGAGALFNAILDLIGNTPRKPSVMKTSAKSGKGIKELASTIDKLLNGASSTYKERERKMLQLELKDMVLNMVEQKVSFMLEQDSSYKNFVEQLVNKSTDPYSAAEKVTSIILRE